MKTRNNEINYLKEARELLIDIDMVNGFIKEGSLAAPSIGRIIPRQIELLDEAVDSNKTGIAFVKDAHSYNATEFKTYPRHCLLGSSESMLVDELKKYEQFALSYLKNSTNLIFAPFLQKDLLKLNKLERIRLMGCLSEVCVLNGAIGLKTFFDEIDKDIEICVESDAIDTFDAPNHPANLINEDALNKMEANGIKILSKKR